MIKRVAFMTGGGDSAGINSFIAAAVRHGIRAYGAEFIGIKEAFEGASASDIESFVVRFSLEGIEDLESRPSTVLASSRFNPFSEQNKQAGYPERILRNLEKLGVDAVLLTGGNDTIKSGLELHQRGIPVIAAPKSIDNDVSGTDTMLGFKTAVTFGSTAFRATAQSARTHRRISIVEIMGRNAGWLALEIGIAGGADLILIPEIPITLTRLCSGVDRIYKQQGFVNIAVSEGVEIPIDDPVLKRASASSPVVKAMIEENLGVDAHGNKKLGGVGQIMRRAIALELRLRSLEEVRTADIGFHLRGLAPVADDILLGIRFGIAAVNLLFSGVSGMMVGIQGEKIVPVPFEEAIEQKLVDWPYDELKSVGVLVD
jgi:6-phosphofructokinase 1